MEKKIAIIIPAYKSHFLRQTLDSIAMQTNREFTVYIGDDASPHNLEEIVSCYVDKMDIIYRRFDNNLGRIDLPGHWGRCIDLSNEPVIWFFSDDDLMPQDGVERIVKALEDYGVKHRMFRFPLAVIDGNDQIKHKNPLLPKGAVLGYHFLLDKLEGRIYSAACEYVFSRDAYDAIGGFVKFPLAWCSDDATWTSLGDCVDGMIALPGNPVCWRNVEGENISCSADFDKEKLMATRGFLRWIAIRYPHRLKDKELRHAMKKYTHTVLYYSLYSRYSYFDLLRICVVLWKFCPPIALSVAFRMCKSKLKKKRT